VAGSAAEPPPEPVEVLVDPVEVLADPVEVLVDPVEVLVELFPDPPHAAASKRGRASVKTAKGARIVAPG
jgi:hypothetical protein